MKLWNRFGYTITLTALVFMMVGCENSSSDTESGQPIDTPSTPGDDLSQEPIQKAGTEEATDSEVSEEGNEGITPSDLDGGENESFTCEPVGEQSSTWHADINRIFFENCTVCHADEPLYGAPMSLSSYESTQSAAFSNPDVSMLEMIRARIADGSMPPASQPGMSDEDREIVDRWVAECGPEGEPVEGEEWMPPKTQVPPPPTDAMTLSVDAGGFKVPLKDDHYMCFPFTLDLEKDMDIVRFDFALDNPEVIHHVVLYGDPKNKGGDTPFECGGIAVDHSEFMYAWAPGGLPLQFPEGFGFPAEAGQNVLLQIHYNNVKKIEGLEDSTGLTLYLKEKQEQEVGMTAVGPLQIVVPPFSEGFSESACSVQEEVNMMMSFPHMHETGARFEQILRRADGTEELVIKLEKWDFNEQPGFHTPFTLQPGDKLITRCDFENPNAYTVTQGDNTQDEMCFNFVYTYPSMEVPFCDEPLDLEDLIQVDEEPGVCAQGVQVGPQVSGTFSDEEWSPEAPVLNTLPEGEWLMTELVLLLGKQVVTDYQINLDASYGVAQATMIASSGEGTGVQDIVFDMEFALSLVIGVGGTFPLDSDYSASGTFASKEDGSGLERVEMACEDGPVELSSMQLIEDGDSLYGLLVFDASYGPITKSEYLVRLERP